MYLKKEFAAILESDPGLRQEMATDIGVTPLTIKRAIDKNKEGKKSRLVSRLGLRWLTKHFKKSEQELIAEQETEAV